MAYIMATRTYKRATRSLAAASYPLRVAGPFPMTGPSMTLADRLQVATEQRDRLRAALAAVMATPHSPLVSRMSMVNRHPTIRCACVVHEDAYLLSQPSPSSEEAPAP